MHLVQTVTGHIKRQLGLIKKESIRNEAHPRIYQNVRSETTSRMLD